jgi:hypothetical protein|tara:strand:+ start:7164 stop:7694 length:531 start_codon:yes stop_codon:yes gene_type:complete
MAFTNEQVVTEVKYFLGNPPETVIDDTTLTSIVERVMTRYNLDYNEDSDFCKATYYSLLETLRWLIRKGNMESGSSDGVAAVKEKVGNTEISTTYKDSPSEDTGWENLLQDYLSHPEYICEELKDLALSGQPSVYFGGVSVSERDRVNNNPDSFNGWDVKAPYRKNSICRKYSTKR